MNAASFTARTLSALLFLCASLFLRAAEPASLAGMTDKEFTQWLHGTEWEFSIGEEGNRKIWFVTPDVSVFSRVGEKGEKQASAFSWSTESKGTAKVAFKEDGKSPMEVTVSGDLRTASIKSHTGKATWKARQLPRPPLPIGPEMTEAEFKTWLKGVEIKLDGLSLEFAGDNTVRLVTKKKNRLLKLRFIRPGLLSYHGNSNPHEAALMVFDKDLKSMKFYASEGLRKGKVRGGAKQPDGTSGDGKVVMEDLKPIPLAGTAASVKALLVRDLGSSKFAGSASVLSLSALPLTGDKAATVAFNQDVGETMRKALREVARFEALRHGGWPRAHEIQLSFEDKYGAKDGPSAAVACALLLDSAITGGMLDPDFAVTGDLNADGAVQPIGGVHAKLRGATKLKCRLLAIPAKNAAHATDIVLTEGLKPFLDIQVFTCATFDEVLAIARADKTEEMATAIRDFAALAKTAAADERALRAPTAIEKLQLILKKAPAHFSARVLLLHATGKLPKILSPAGTLAELDQAVGDLKTAIGGDLTVRAKLDGGQVAAARGGLLKMRPLADSRVRPLLDAWAAWGDLADQLVRGGGTLNERELKEWRAADSRIEVEQAKLGSNEAFREELE